MAPSEIIPGSRVLRQPDIPAAEWNACANPEPPVPPSLDDLDTLGFNRMPSKDSCDGSKAAALTPLFPTRFSRALPRRPDSACARTGWGPRHLLARLDGRDRRHRALLSEIAFAR